MLLYLRLSSRIRLEILQTASSSITSTPNMNVRPWELGFAVLTRASIHLSFACPLAVFLPPLPFAHTRSTKLCSLVLLIPLCHFPYITPPNISYVLFPLGIPPSTSCLLILLLYPPTIASCSRQRHRQDGHKMGYSTSQDGSENGD